VIWFLVSFANKNANYVCTKGSYTVISRPTRGSRDIITKCCTKPRFTNLLWENTDAGRWTLVDPSHRLKHTHFVM